VAHVLGCATDIMYIRGAHGRAPQIKVTCGLICVAHARCTTKPQNGAPQIEFLLVVIPNNKGLISYPSTFTLRGTLIKVSGNDPLGHLRAASLYLSSYGSVVAMASVVVA
jgi:hypothetical protein